MFLYSTARQEARLGCAGRVDFALSSDPDPLIRLPPHSSHRLFEYSERVRIPTRPGRGTAALMTGAATEAAATWLTPKTSRSAPMASCTAHTNPRGRMRNTRHRRRPFPRLCLLCAISAWLPLLPRVVEACNVVSPQMPCLPCHPSLSRGARLPIPP